MNGYDQFPAGQITITRAERQKREALERRRRRKSGRETILGKVFFIFLLSFASVFVYALIKSKITGEPPELAGRQFYIVISGSMEPAVAPGNLLVVKEIDPADLKIGDIITFIDPADPARVISHRIKEVAGRSFITRGDANNMDDPEPVPAENVLGKVEYNIPYAGYIFDFAQTTKGLITMVLIPSLLIVVFEFRKLLQYVAMIEKEKDTGSATRPE